MQRDLINNEDKMRKIKFDNNRNNATKKEKIVTTCIAILLISMLFVCITAIKGIAAAISIFVISTTITGIVILTLCIVFEAPPFSKDQ